MLLDYWYISTVCLKVWDLFDEVSYRLALPSYLFNIQGCVFRKYHSIYVSYPLGQILYDLSFVEEPETILDHQRSSHEKQTFVFVKTNFHLFHNLVRFL